MYIPFTYLFIAFGPLIEFLLNCKASFWRLDVKRLNDVQKKHITSFSYLFICTLSWLHCIWTVSRRRNDHKWPVATPQKIGKHLGGCFCLRFVLLELYLELYVELYVEGSVKYLYMCVYIHIPVFNVMLQAALLLSQVHLQVQLDNDNCRRSKVVPSVQEKKNFFLVIRNKMFSIFPVSAALSSWYFWEHDLLDEEHPVVVILNIPKNFKFITRRRNEKQEVVDYGHVLTYYS